MAKDHKKKKFLPKPYFPGGNRAMGKFIDTHLKYPNKALSQQVEGVVRIKIAINYQGKVTGHEIKRSLGYGCDEEAWRLAQMLRFQVDGMVRRGKILFHKTLNIRFRLPKSQATKTKGMSFQYKITDSKKSRDKPAKNGYSYVIEV